MTTLAVAPAGSSHAGAVLTRRVFLQLLLGLPLMRKLRAFATRFTAIAETDLELLFHRCCFAESARLGSAG